MSKTDNGTATTTAKKPEGSKTSGNGSARAPKKVQIKPSVPKTPTLTPEQALQSHMDSIQRKYELISVRNRFLETRAKLNSYLAEQGTDFDSSLDHNNLKVVLQDDRNYNETPISISNGGLVRDFCEFLKSRVDTKLLQIEAQLLS
jgi:hypothetical protein